MYKIAIVDDDKVIREELSILLHNNGYDVCCLLTFLKLPLPLKKKDPIIFITSRNNILFKNKGTIVTRMEIMDNHSCKVR